MLPQEMVRKKRDGAALTASELNAFIKGLVAGEVTEAQAAALAMATFFQGMASDETVALTLAMRDSGHTLTWPNLDGPVLDKHSTGGIGDKVSLILAPLIAAIGGYVPMISGRGLGHTGGTLDKLESIPGYAIRIPLNTFQEVVRSTGLAIVGATAEIAPADGKLYAIRDVTATVDIPPMIIASILSKKLAAGLDGLVMDVKIGSGAFLPALKDGKALARDLVGIARGAGLPCKAVLSDMNQCLGRTAGNALEVMEAIDILRGRAADPNLRTVTLSLASDLALLGGLAKTMDDALAKLVQALDDGHAAERFERMVKALGGPGNLLDRPEHYLATSLRRHPVFLGRKGRVSRIDAKALGFAIIELGGGRGHPTDRIDHRVGLSEVRQIGEEVGPDQPFAWIHAASDIAAERATQRVRTAVEVSDHTSSITAPAPIIDRIA